MFRRFIDSPYTLWVLLALPSAGFLAALLSGTPGPQGQPVSHMLLHPTGEFSARFMIIAMILTPMRMIFPNSGFWRWMMKRRRYFGVAAGLYAVFHPVLSIVDMQTLQAILSDALHFGIWTGWLAMLIFVPLLLTSNDYFVRRMGPAWKTLQRWTYPAAVLTLLHWIFVHNNLGPALVHFLPLAGLEAYRIYRNRSRAQDRVAA